MTRERHYPNSLTLPIGATATGWLLCDRLHVPAWSYGVFWTLIAILWLAVILLVVLRVKSDSDELPASEVERRLAALEGRR